MFGKLLKFPGAIFLILAIAIGGLLYFGVRPASDSRELASQSVTHLSANEVEPAYALLHNNLKSKYTLEDFRAQVQQGGLNTIKEVGWNGFEVRDGLEIIAGSGEMVKGQKLKAEIKATAIENNDKPGILGYDFQPAE